MDKRTTIRIRKPLKETLEDLKELKFQLHKYEDESKFCLLELPEDWKSEKGAEPDSLNLLDSNGNIRAKIESRFYIKLLTRFCITTCSPKDSENCPSEYQKCMIIFDRKEDKKIATIDIFEVGDDSETDCYQCAEAYLKAMYPYFEDALAYW